MKNNLGIKWETLSFTRCLGKVHFLLFLSLVTPPPEHKQPRTCVANTHAAADARTLGTDARSQHTGQLLPIISTDTCLYLQGARPWKTSIHNVWTLANNASDCIAHIMCARKGESRCLQEEAFPKTNGVTFGKGHGQTLPLRLHPTAGKQDPHCFPCGYSCPLNNFETP